MSYIKSYLAVLAISLFLIALPEPAEGAETSAQRAREILREVDDLWRGKSSHGKMTMRIKTAHYTRSMSIEHWSKGKEKSLIRIISPLKEKGTATLKSGTSIYTYLPKTDRTLRLTSGMMMGSWMGSHFTNDDLVKEARMEDDYDPAVSFEGKRDGLEIIEFTLTPKPEAAVVWGRVVLIVKMPDRLPLIEHDYDEDFKIVRTIVWEKIKTLGGRKIPSVMRVTPADKPDEYTELVNEEMEFALDIPDSFFSIQRLRRK